MAEIKSAPATPREAPLHLDEFIRAHGRAEFGAELMGMYRFVALAAGRTMDTATGFRAAVEAFRRQPSG